MPTRPPNQPQRSKSLLEEHNPMRGTMKRRNKIGKPSTGRLQFPMRFPRLRQTSSQKATNLSRRPNAPHLLSCPMMSMRRTSTSLGRLSRAAADKRPRRPFSTRSSRMSSTPASSTIATRFSSPQSSRRTPLAITRSFTTPST